MPYMGMKGRRAVFINTLTLNVVSYHEIEEIL